jgi:TonB family protein
MIDSIAVRHAIIGVFLLVAATNAICQPTGSDKGQICGIVFNENGDPASNVYVVAMLQSPGGHTGGYPSTYADESGHYCIGGLPLGRYTLSGDDEGLGYPMRGLSFYSWHSPAPHVALIPAKSDANLDWKLPFRAGFLYLHIPAVHSAQEMVPIAVELIVRARPKLGRISDVTSPKMGKSDEIKFLLPPQEDVLLRVTAADHQSQADGGCRGMLLNVPPGAIEHVSIASLVRCSSLSRTGANTSEVAKPAAPPEDEMSSQLGKVAPRLIHSVKANYSAEAIKAHYEGVCLVQLVVDTEGRPADVRIIRPLGMYLDENAIQAVMQYRFKPGILHGEQAPMRISIAVPFRLPN